MAALQKIRSKGTLLIAVIGLALFAFIAEEFFRSLEVTSNQSKQQIGEVYGKNLSVQEYQALIDEFTEAYKFTRGVNSLSDVELNQLKDQVWQTYVNNKLIEHEADKLGLTVTDDEMKMVIEAGTSPLLMQTPFRNEKTGRFDSKMLADFLKNYESMQQKADQIPAEYMEYYQNLYKFWSFIEKTLRESLLNEKYQALLGRSIISNPISAKLAFEGRSSKSTALLVSVPYTAIADNAVKVDDADLKKLYESQKDMFMQFGESRDIKYIDIAVTASDADKAALNKEMDEFAGQLQNGEDVANLVRTSGSMVNYAALPVSKKSLPYDIQSVVDSLSIGVVKGPYYNASDNSMNLVKILSTTQLPDSVAYRMIQVGGATLEAVRTSADSIYKALQGGASFEELAKKYNQPAEVQWLTSAAYETATMDDENRKFVQTLTTTGVNGVQNIEMAQGNVIVQITDRKAMLTKYDIAVIKRPIEFSKETYSKAYNAFSHFIAANPTLKDIEANATKSGYTVMQRQDLFNYEHYVANVPSTKDAMRWIFDAKKGDVSPLYECGNNDHLMIVAVTDIHPEGYRTLDDAQIKSALTAIALRDKKAEKLMADLKNVKNMEQAVKVPNIVTDTLKNISFDSPAFVSATGISEPVLAGGISSAKVNVFRGPVKGQNGVYMYQVTDREKTNAKFNEAEVESSLNDMNLRGVGQFINELYKKAEVKDRRYLYF